MMPKKTISILLILVLIALFGYAQTLILKKREGYRIEEKILMLSDRPKVTKILSFGFHGALSDLLWVRAIQYFGGNFSSLDEPDKKEGFVNLFRNLAGLDPHFIGAYQFGGFVMNEAMNDTNLAIEYLLQGAANNPDHPEAWNLKFDAGFIAFHQLEDYNVAKDLFLQAVFDENVAQETEIHIDGLAEGYIAESLIDGDPYSQVKIDPSGSVELQFDEPRDVGRIHIQSRTPNFISFRLQYKENPQAAVKTIHSITTPTFDDFDDPPLRTQIFLLDQFQAETEDGLIAFSEFQIYGPRDPNVPPYVERMIYEMDRNAGRFRAAWDQYARYFEEARQKGDEVSAQLALEKLSSIYTNKALELLEEAVSLYEENEDQLPSPQMREVIEQGYLQQVIDQQIAEDPNFQEEVLPVLLGQDRNLFNILTTWDGKAPHLLITTTDEYGNVDWYVTSHLRLLDRQESILERLQKGVDKFQEEYNRLPESLSELAQESWFSMTEDAIEDPLGGEFYLDPENGEVGVRNMKY